MVRSLGLSRPHLAPTDGERDAALLVAGATSQLRGGNGGVLAEVIPEIELVIGKQPPRRPSTRPNRITASDVFQAFVATLAAVDTRSSCSWTTCNGWTPRPSPSCRRSSPARPPSSPLIGATGRTRSMLPPPHVGLGTAGGPGATVSAVGRSAPLRRLSRSSATRSIGTDEAGARRSPLSCSEDRRQPVLRYSVPEDAQPGRPLALRSRPGVVVLRIDQIDLLASRTMSST